MSTPIVHVQQPTTTNQRATPTHPPTHRCTRIPIPSSPLSLRHHTVAPAHDHHEHTNHKQHNTDQHTDIKLPATRSTTNYKKKHHLYQPTNPRLSAHVANIATHHDERILEREQTNTMDRHQQICNDHNLDRRNYRDWETDRKSTRLNSSHEIPSRMPSSA